MTVEMLAQAMRMANQDRVPHNRTLNIKELHSMGATTFEGTGNPADAES